MYCNACGTALHPGQTVCTCGRPAPASATDRPSRVAQHVRVLGVLWLAYSIFGLLGGGILLVLANTLFVHLRSQGVPMFLQPLLSLIGCFLIVKSILGIAAGWAILDKQSWGRVLTLIVAFLALFNIPLGTALGIYTLWVLMPGDAERDYLALGRGA